MSTTSDLKAIRAADAAQDKSQFLGRFCWYSVNELSINREALCRIMIANGLQAFLPRPPQDSEVFRRVCTGVQRNRVATSEAKAYANYLVRDVGHDRDKIYKRIVRETVHTGNRSLSHKSDLCSVTFSRSTSIIEFDCATYDPIAQDMIQEIKAGFAAEQGNLNGYAVRELIRKILVKSNAVNLRGNGGGLYFISEVHAAHLDGLEKLASKIPDNAVMFNTHGLMDDDKQRKMLRTAYESESAKEINAAIAEITEVIAVTQKTGMKIPAAKVVPFLGVLNGARAKDKEYKELLSIGRSTSAGRLTILQTLVMQLSQMQ